MNTLDPTEIIKHLSYSDIINLCLSNKNNYEHFCNNISVWNELLKRDFNVTAKSDARKEYIFYRFIGFDLDHRYTLVEINDMLKKMGKPPVSLDPVKVYQSFSQILDKLPRQSNEIWTLENYLAGWIYFSKKRETDLPPKKTWVSTMSGVDMPYPITLANLGNKVVAFST